MISNNNAIGLFNIGTCTEIFTTYLKSNGFDDVTISNFTSKATEIYNKLSTNKKNIGLLVGKVQSGKTTTFSATIAKYFDNGYDLCIILTALENVLHEQTTERMKNVFCSKQPTNIDVFNTDAFLARNTHKRIEKVKSDFDNGRKYIVTILKNKQIDKIREVLSTHKIWKNKKILIIDDEADLASTGSNDLTDIRAANLAIGNLLENINNYNYLSVTATPQAQILINDEDTVKPKHVFTYNPGKGYMGINEFFNESSFFKFIKRDEWNPENIEFLPESLKEAVIKYFINISYLILDKNKIETTTMLIHTSIGIEQHYKLMRLIIKYKESLVQDLKRDVDNLDYQLQCNVIKKIFDESNYNSLIWDDSYIQLLKKIINSTNINVINSESEDAIIENLNNIVLGSKKLERGVTLDNLLLTYIMNFTEGVTAVDTVLQRARWFGYREKIKKFLTIYITEDLHTQYKENIIPSENELWKRLVDAEIKDNFKDFEKYITLSGKSAPTQKVKTIRSSGDKIVFYDSIVERSVEVERNAKSIFLHFNQFPRANINIVGRTYTGFTNLTFLEFNEQIKEEKIYETIGIDKYFYDEIKQKAQNYKFVLLFLDNLDSKNFRERTSENGKYQLFEGSTEDTGFPGEQALYKVTGLHDKVIFCLHKIRDKNDNKLRYYVSLHLPKDNIFSGKFYVK